MYLFHEANADDWKNHENEMSRNFAIASRVVT